MVTVCFFDGDDSIEEGTVHANGDQGLTGPAGEEGVVDLGHEVVGDIGVVDRLGEVGAYEGGDVVGLSGADLNHVPDISVAGYKINIVHMESLPVCSAGQVQIYPFSVFSFPDVSRCEAVPIRRIFIST